MPFKNLLTIAIDDVDDFNQGFIAAKKLIDANIVLFDDAWTIVSTKQLLVHQHTISYLSGNLLL